MQQCRAAGFRWLPLLLLALTGSGCYRYVPVEPAAVGPKEEVRVRVTEAAAERLVKDFGAYTGVLQGELASQGPDSLSLSILIGRDYRGMALENVRQVLVLGRNEVADVQRRVLSPGRPSAAAVGVLAVVGVLIRSVVQMGDPNPGDEDPPLPPPSGYRGSIRIQIR